MLRERHGISQRNLAKHLGITNPFISNIENGFNTPNITLILKIADYFGVSADVLVLDELELDDT